MTQVISYQQEIKLILKSYNLSHNFIVSYALACAKDVNPKPDAKTRKCFELLDKWLINADSVSNRELRDAADAAYHAAYAACAATYAAAADAAYHAANAAYYAADASASSLDSAQAKYKELLLSLIRNKYGDIGLELMKVGN